MLILLILLIAAGIFVYEWIFSRHCLNGFEAEIALDQPRAQVLDSFDIILTLSNRNWLILPIIRFHLLIKEELICNDSERIHTSLLFHQKSRRRISLTGKKRGIHEIKAEIEIRDFFGLIRQTVSVEAVRIIIHPEINEFSLPDSMSGTEGDFLVQRWIFPDPIFFTGNRPYTGHEAMKEIDWKATARNNELRVKQHDTTASFNAVICLLCENNENLYSEDSQYLEEAIKLAASLLHEAPTHQAPVGLITNAVSKVEFGSVFRPDNGLNHIIRCYDTLSCLAPYQRVDTNRIFYNIHSFMTSGSQCIVLANTLTDSIVNGLTALVQKGIRPTVFLYNWNELIELPANIPIIAFKKEVQQ